MNKIQSLLIVTISLIICSLGLAADKEKQTTSSTSKTTTTATAKTEHTIVLPSNLKWGDAPPGLPAGGKLAVLEGDPGKKGPFTIRLQAPDGYKVPAHTHPTAEKITVISGSFNIGMGDKMDESAGHEMGPGGFVIMPAGMKHFAWMKGETVIQVSGDGPFQIKYVNPSDDPRKAKP